MTWISIKDNKRISTCTAVGTDGITEYSGPKFTQVKLNRWMGNSDPELFQFLNDGIKITEAGLYLISGSILVGTLATSNQSVCLSIRYVNEDIPFGSTEEKILIASKYQSDQPIGAIHISAKSIELEKPCTLFLAVRNEANTIEASANNYISTFTAANTGTSLTIVKLNSKRSAST